MRQRGFTVIELVFLIIIFIMIALVFWTQFNTVQSMARDDKRRTAINAMYYDLEDVFYAKNNYYPKSIDEKNLNAMDSTLFTDPNGVKLGEPSSDYTYLPVNCVDNKCKSYTLRTTLEKEADFIKTSKN